MIENASDLLASKGWDKSAIVPPSQRQLPLDMSDSELKLLHLFKKKNVCEIDEIIGISGLSSSQTALTLLIS